MTNIKLTRADRIRVLLAPLGATHIDIQNNSARHHGHAGDNGSGETHYVVTVVSPTLAAQPKITAHRRVFALLAAEFQTGLHALELSIQTNKTYD